jgi:hypothetical protein
MIIIYFDLFFNIKKFKVEIKIFIETCNQIKLIIIHVCKEKKLLAITKREFRKIKRMM